MRGTIRMLENSIIDSSLEYIKSYHLEIDYYDKELNRDLKEIVVQEINNLINNKRAYIHGIEKIIFARVLSKNFIYVHEILNNLLENEI
jgi:sulfatase maturation enzyme AslB (radical SAM superfamily)